MIIERYPLRNEERVHRGNAQYLAIMYTSKYTSKCVVVVFLSFFSNCIPDRKKREAPFFPRRQEMEQDRTVEKMNG